MSEQQEGVFVPYTLLDALPVRDAVVAAGLAQLQATDPFVVEGKGWVRGPVRELARRLHVSRSRVRVSLELLESLGMLTVRTHWVPDESGRPPQSYRIEQTSTAHQESTDVPAA